MESERYVVRMADEDDAAKVTKFNERVLFSDAGKLDPFTASMRSEIKYATDSLYGLNNFITFVLVDTFGDQIIGRGLLNFCPTADDYDISAYGHRAAEIFNQCKSAVFGGDLIEPSYRGKSLHALLIKTRIAWLLNRDFEYLFIPILKGNHTSLNSYKKLVIEYLGSKIMRYQSPVEVELYGKCLKELRGQL